MKKIQFAIFIVTFLTSTFFSLNARDIQALAEKYKSGQIALESEFILTIDNFLDCAKTTILSDLAWNNEGKFYISDVMADNIKVIDETGTFKFTIGRSGKGPGDLAGPSTMACSKKHLLIYETVNRRISIFNHSGEFIKHVNFENGLYIKKIGSLENGNYILEKTNIIQEKKIMYLESILELHSRDLEYIKTLHTDKVIWHSIVTKPKLKSLVIPFGPEVFWDILPGNKLVVGSSDKKEILIIDTIKNKMKSFIYECSPIRITSEDKKHFLDNMPQISPNGRFKLGATPFARKNLQFPKFKPAFQKIMCDYEGNILIFPNKNFSERNLIHFDAFTNTGQYINRVKVIYTERITPEYFIAGPKKTFWNFIERKKDLERVLVKFKVK